MREILTLSLPAKTKKTIKKRAKARGFSSLSGYIQYLVNEDEYLISEEELLKTIEKGRKEYKEGKCMVYMAN